MRAHIMVATGLILLVLGSCRNDVGTVENTPCDNDSMTLQVGAGTPTAFVEGAAQCGGGLIDPLLTGEVLPEEPLVQRQITIALFSGWDPSWHVPGTVFGYRTGMELWVPTNLIVDGEPVWPLNTPLTLSLGRYYADPADGCHNGTPTGTITFTAVGPPGGPVAGTFAGVVVPAATGGCPPNVQSGVSDVILSGTFAVTRVQ